MSKLVRARVKAPEYRTFVAKCCGEASKVYDSLGEFVIDLESTHSFGGGCEYCGFPHTQALAVEIVNGSFIDFDLLDLDEGPMEYTP